MKQNPLAQQNGPSDPTHRPSVSCPAADEPVPSMALNVPDRLFALLDAIAALEPPFQPGLGLPPRMLSRYEEQWHKLVTTLDASWEWDKVTAIWQQLIELDFRFFRGRFRSVIAEILPTVRYIPPTALSFILQYCRHQPAEIKKLYRDIWEYQLHTQSWMHPRQADVIASYLERWHGSTPASPPHHCDFRIR